MIAPVGPIPPAPLSPQEAALLNVADRNAIDAWRFRLEGMPPGANDFARLYIAGKVAGVREAKT